MKNQLAGESHPITRDMLLLVLRVGVAALMLTHGLPKLAKLFSGSPVEFPAVFGLSAEVSLVLAVLTEVGGSILIAAGLATRLAAVALAITMLTAAFLVHATDPFAQKELALLYTLVYAALVLGGSGKYSLDYALWLRSSAKV